jgi:hypothetical protein
MSYYDFDYAQRQYDNMEPYEAPECPECGMITCECEEHEDE